MTAAGESGFAVRSGPWDADAITEYLTSTVIPIRFATSGRYPLVQSLWYSFDHAALWCATQQDSVLARRIHRDARIAFEVSADSPPYCGVRGTGTAHLVPEAAERVLTDLLTRYDVAVGSQLRTWLLSRLDTEVAIRVDGLALTSWDFRHRM